MASFGDFVIAQSGMTANQIALNITGNNITNINSPGYTRQSLDQVSFMINGSSFARGSFNAMAGAGAMMKGISQLRDPYLDIRYRNSMSNVGYADGLLYSMEQIEQVINDVNQEGITTAFQDLLDRFVKLDANNVGEKEFDALVRSSAEELCQLLNNAAKDLQNVKDTCEDSYMEDVDNLNTLIEKIQEVNQQIRWADVNGDTVLELRDERNRLVDELSQYMKIEVTYETVDVGSGVKVENMIIKMADQNGKVIPDPNDPVTPSEGIEIINGSSAIKFEAMPNDDYCLSYSAMTDINGNVVTGEDAQAADQLGEGQIYGALESLRQMLACEGSFDAANPTETKGIPYYMQSLDLLAQRFAEEMNRINTEDGQGNPFDPNDISGAGNLFGTTDGTADITAANIGITEEWRTGDVHVVTSAKPGSGNTANDNLSRFENAFSATHDFEANGNEIYSGSFESFYANMQGVLGSDMQMATNLFNTYATASDELNNSRESVYGVDLNEEGINMIEYQKAFSASCRMMTALDELMEKIINGMGVVGR